MAIDLQPAFSDPESPWFTPALPAASEAVAGLVPLFGDRVIFTRFVPPAQPAGSWGDYYRRWDFALRPEADRLWELDEPWRGRTSVSSHTFSKWAAVRDLIGPDAAVVLCGVSTDCCVLATAWAAIDDGAWLRVVSDACAAKTPEAHEQALASLASRAPQLAVVTSAEERERHRSPTPPGR